MYRLVNASKFLKISRSKIRDIRQISISNRLCDDNDDAIDDGPRELGIDESWKPPRIEFDPVWFQSRNDCTLNTTWMIHFLKPFIR